MSKQYQGTMGVAFPIESIDRKLALRRETAGTKTVGAKTVNGAKYMGGFTRTYGVVTGSGKRESVKVQYAFVRKFGRTSRLTTREVMVRQIFQRVAQAVPVLMEDLSQITNIQTLYLQACADVKKKINGVSALGRATLRGWVWAVQYQGAYMAEEEGEEYDVTQFPTHFDN